MRKPNIVVSPHSIDRFRQLIGDESMREEVAKRHLIDMYNDGIPWGIAQYQNNKLFLSKYKNQSNKELVLACVEKNWDKKNVTVAIIKTVLTKDHAMANMQMCHKHPVIIW